MSDREWDSEIVFSQKAKMCKIWGHTDKNGNIWMNGKIGTNCALIIQKALWNDAKDNEYVAYICPINYTKKGDNSEPKTEKKNEADQEVPF